MENDPSVNRKVRRILRAALYPLAALYGAITTLRREAYRRGWIASERLVGPVVSVGNIGLGGRGKTPVVAWIAATLREGGFPVSILSRGYRGSYQHDALLVSDGGSVCAEPDAAGDEPVMLARRLRGVYVAVARRRVDAGRLVERRFGPCIHVLDDGFQHLRLFRDLDLVCLEASDARDRPLPAGRLRELPSALRCADVALVSETAPGAAESVNELQDLLGRDRVFTMRRRFCGFFATDGRAAAAPRNPLLLAAIARPERFFDDVAAKVPEVAARVAFRDHHRFHAHELDRTARLAALRGADAVVTTEKDLVRLPQTPAFGIPLLTFRTMVEIDDVERLRALLLEKVGAGWRARDVVPEKPAG